MARPALVDTDGDGTLRIGCDGDSNSMTNRGLVRWCERAATMLPQAAVTRAGGQVVEPVQWLNASIVGWFACDRSAHALQLAKQGADIVISALGTNDIRTTIPPDEVLRCLLATKAAVAPRQYYVALIPPIYSPDSDADALKGAINQLNTMIRQTFGEYVIDFHDGFTTEMFDDPRGVHLNDAGQTLRAKRAIDALTAR